MPRPNSQTFGENFYATILESALADQRKARETVLEVPNHAGVPGELSGRQRKQGRKPASAAAAALA